MPIEQVKEDASGLPELHTHYSNSFLHMRPAPEYASGEVVLASFIRNICFSGVPESNVPKNGSDLSKRINREKDNTKEKKLANDSWQTVIESSLKSPKQPNQSARRFLQIYPIVPDCAIYSSSARLSTNSWNPGEMVQRIFEFGAKNHADAENLWKKTFETLAVSDNKDDPWALGLQLEFERRRPEKIKWQLQDFSENEMIKIWREGGGESPSTRFMSDMDQVLNLKEALTRRQWISMLECLLRLACGAHVLWLCRANIVTYKLFLDALRGDEPLPTSQIVRDRLAVNSQGFWRYGQLAGETIENFAREYLEARVGLNALLHLTDDMDLEIIKGSNPLGSPDSIQLAATELQKSRGKLSYENHRNTVRAVVDGNPRLFSVKKGIGSNIKEFLRHCLGQRQTTEEGMKSYDQGYWLRKNGYHNSAKWIVSAGPVAVLLLVYCCSKRTVGPATTDDLCRHLGEYGITLKLDDVTGTGDLGPTLRRMGLVTDSPDAEGGMLIRNPFRTKGEKHT